MQCLVCGDRPWPHCEVGPPKLNGLTSKGEADTSDVLLAFHGSKLFEVFIEGPSPGKFNGSLFAQSAFQVLQAGPRVLELTGEGCGYDLCLQGL